VSQPGPATSALVKPFATGHVTATDDARYTKTTRPRSSCGVA
jgi:hypothetical protein